MTSIQNYIDDILYNGFTILEGAVQLHHLDILFNNMIKETYRLMKIKAWGGVGAFPGHLQQNPPRHKPYVFRDIVSNPLVIKIAKEILGAGLFNDFYSANVNCPGSQIQLVHMDCQPLWLDNSIVHPPATLIINISLIDTNENNGSIELWPGTHLLTGVPKFPDEETLDKRKIFSPPIRANTKKGSIIIRDARMWHRGTSNYSNKPRHMIALMYHTHWYTKGDVLDFESGCENDILDNDLYHHARFVDTAIDHNVDQTKGLYLKIDK